MVSSTIFTRKELEVINKKMKNKKLSQVDSNYLYKFIRPKLKEMISIDAKSLLEILEYRQKILSIENKIKKVLLENIPEVDSIIIYGSAIQNNYRDYNDIDIIVSTKTKPPSSQKEKWEKMTELKETLKKHNILADIQILSKEALEYNATRNPNLIYQLKDHKVIYGKLKLSNALQIYNADLLMKLDWSDIYVPQPKGNEIYHALRNAVLVRLILNKIVDNKQLKESLYLELGKNLIDRLKNNQESKSDRKRALVYLKELIKKTRSEIKGGLWEKIELSR